MIRSLRSARWRTRAVPTLWLCGVLSGLLSTAMHAADSVQTGVESNAVIQEPPITESDRQHWAWMPLARPPLPDVKQVAWPENCVDYFILAELESEGLAPAGQADRATLLRRLKFDLHGLPPTLEEQRRFLEDRTPTAYRELVDRLLADPAYGERWAQHWLDLARYAETDGFEHDKIRPDAWRFRDWVINSLNQDLSYDRFITQQLLGDGSGSSTAQVPTMFCLAGPDMPDINEQDLRKHDKLNEIASTVGATLLAMQVQCAQCHDHKYDPISQADFYRLRAIFEAALPKVRRDVQLDVFQAADAPQPSYLYHRGELSQRGPAVPPALPRVAVVESESYLCRSDAPREDFANWLFSPTNPLTARVIANRIWQHHFGLSLCENPSDFGVVAGEPTHPGLLDWLANELRDHGWSMKHLHRTIVMSATYRQASHKTHPLSSWERSLDQDPDLELYSRFPRQRLEGEVVRDALLLIGGQLNRPMGGASVRPPLPQELTSTLLKGQWEVSPAASDHRRRSVYIFARRNLRYPIFDAFDRPDAGASCARRERSTTAIQALSMLNSPLTLDAAESLTVRLLAANPGSTLTDCESLIQQLFQRVLGRRPTLEEQQQMAQFFQGDGEAALEPQGLEVRLTTACIAMFNTNEFLYID